MVSQNLHLVVTGMLGRIMADNINPSKDRGVLSNTAKDVTEEARAAVATSMQKMRKHRVTFTSGAILLFADNPDEIKELLAVHEKYVGKAAGDVNEKGQP